LPLLTKVLLRCGLHCAAVITGRNTGLARPSVRPSVPYTLTTPEQKAHRNKKWREERSPRSSRPNLCANIQLKKSKVKGSGLVLRSSIRPHHMSALGRHDFLVLYLAYCLNNTVFNIDVITRSCFVWLSIGSLAKINTFNSALLAGSRRIIPSRSHAVVIARQRARCVASPSRPVSRCRCAPPFNQ